MHAICLDHPEMFWYNGYSLSYSYISSTGQVTSITYNLKSPNVTGTSTPVYTTSNIVSYNTAMWNEFHRVAEELDLEKLVHYINNESAVTTNQIEIEYYDIAEKALKFINYKKGNSLEKAFLESEEW